MTHQVPNAQDIEHRFTHHPPKDDTVIAKHEHVRRAMRTAAQAVLEDVPVGREQSLAFTALEEAMMWSNAGIARQR